MCTELRTTFSIDDTNDASFQGLMPIVSESSSFGINKCHDVLFSILICIVYVIFFVFVSSINNGDL